MRNRPGTFLALTAPVLLGGAASPQGHEVSASLTGLRSTKGQVLACLTTRADTFPNCDKDPDSRRVTVPAAEHVTLEFGQIPSGNYAISVIHDENANGRLDTRIFIPREGFGFSRDAPARFGPPKFANAVFPVERPVRMTIKVRYLL